MKTLYTHTEEVHNMTAPREVVPVVLKFIKPLSMLDVGCGTGTWLRGFEEAGVTDYLGIDGDYVDRNMLKIPVNKFQAHDLSSSFDLRRKFDLVISLEVAEHLAPHVSDTFIKSLVMHGDVILFSAAIPGQGGQNHLNEQWPEYWETKFNRHGFYFYDVIRPLIWNNDQIDFWYRQNIFLVKKEKPGEGSFRSLPVIHPELYKRQHDFVKEYQESLLGGKQGIKLSLSIFLKALSFKLRSIFGFK